MNNSLEGFNAVLYARVSTKDKGQTNETQIREMRKWCERNKVNIIERSKESIAFTDEESGTVLSRPGLDAAVGHILISRNIQILLCYDQSRLTRDCKIDEIQRLISQVGCQIRFVTSDGDPEDLGTKVTNAVQQVFDQRENEIRRTKTKLGLETRRNQGKHISRPAVFMFKEDVKTAPVGRCNTDPNKGKTITKVYSEKDIFKMALSGISYKQAARIIGVSPSAFLYEMKKEDPSDPKHRCKGKVDRYSTYMAFYRKAVEVRIEGGSDTSESDVQISSDRGDL